MKLFTAIGLRLMPIAGREKPPMSRRDTRPGLVLFEIYAAALAIVNPFCVSFSIATHVNIGGGGDVAGTTTGQETFWSCSRSRREGCWTGRSGSLGEDLPLL
jgi:hypothetical protein